MNAEEAGTWLQWAQSSGLALVILLLQCVACFFIARWLGPPAKNLLTACAELVKQLKADNRAQFDAIEALTKELREQREHAARQFDRLMDRLERLIPREGK